MPNSPRIKRRSSGASGAPSTLLNAELAFNEVDKTLYYGFGTSGLNDSEGRPISGTTLAIAGPGAFLSLTGEPQSVTGNVTFSGALTLSNVGSMTTTGNVTIGGDLIVNGTTTTVNSTTISVDDKNIELGSIASPTDVTADGGGFTLKGTTDKLFRWLDATDAWTSSEHLDLAGGKAFFINGVSVLSGTTLGSGVTSSSLTSVGVLGAGTWQAAPIGVLYGGTGQTTYSNGQLLIGNSTGNTLSKAVLTEGTGISITNGPGSITISATGINSTAGNGIAITGNVISVDVTSGSGLVITAGKLNLDADLTALAGMQVGAATALAALTSTEVAVIDGGTTATATTLALADKLVVNNAGTMVQVALTDLVAFLENGAVSGFDIDGGTY